MERMVGYAQLVFGNPLPFVMGIVALVCAVAAANSRRRRVDRLVSAVLAVISGGVAWYMLHLMRVL